MTARNLYSELTPTKIAKETAKVHKQTPVVPQKVSESSSIKIRGKRNNDTQENSYGIMKSIDLVYINFGLQTSIK